MFHKSDLSHYGEHFPHDQKGHVPAPHDHWEAMQFELPGMDPNEEGITSDEQARRIEYLNTVWWPELLQRVSNERQRLQDQHGESFIAHWERVIGHRSNAPHGFEIG